MYAFMPDIHIGAKYSTESLFQSLNKFFEMIKNHQEPCHCIFVLGDLFDHRLTVDEGKVASLFLANLVCNGCRKDGSNVPVHFIHGTYSHDREQYEMFLPIVNEIPGVSVFYTDKACKGVLMDETKVLYLPQEYQGTVDYTEFFNDTYDIIIGHGPVSSLNKSPCESKDGDVMHSAEQLSSISKITIFGHFHGYTDFGNNVYYGGPWLRWKYGEDIPRVFVLCNDNFEIETYPNEFALEYKTITVSSPDELRSYISQNITTPHRFCVTVSDEDISEYHTIMNINKNNPNISYKISSVKKEETDDKIGSDYIQTEIEEPVPSLISYIKEKYNEDASSEIKEYEDRITKSE